MQIVKLFSIKGSPILSFLILKIKSARNRIGVLPLGSPRLLFLEGNNETLPHRSHDANAMIDDV